MKRINILILLLALTLSACGRNKPGPLGADAPADNVPNIIGSYALNAFDPTGEQYGGTLTITEGGQPNEYELQWLISGGIHVGTGTLEGNQLAVSWHSVSGTDQNVSGIASYTVTVNGELYGTRSIDGVDTPGTETAYPNPK
ncbi:MAG: hypothetical protein HZB18_06410 [Chloroflexi bacterium]|nr:hypothetical protein [Chloroflexota bacterium]